MAETGNSSKPMYVLKLTFCKLNSSISSSISKVTAIIFSIKNLDKINTVRPVNTRANNNQSFLDPKWKCTNTIWIKKESATRLTVNRSMLKPLQR